MRCPKCRSTAVKERPERTAQGDRRFRCLDCTKQFNERSGGLLNRTQYPSDVIALVVLWRLRYKLTLRDLAEMFLIRGFVFTYEAVRDWEAKLTPALAEDLRRSRKGGEAFTIRAEGYHLARRISLTGRRVGQTWTGSGQCLDDGPSRQVSRPLR